MPNPNLKEKIITMLLFEPPDHHRTIWDKLNKTDQERIKNLVARMMITYHTRKARRCSCNVLPART